MLLSSGYKAGTSKLCHVSALLALLVLLVALTSALYFTNRLLREEREEREGFCWKGSIDEGTLDSIKTRLSETKDKMDVMKKITKAKYEALKEFGISLKETDLGDEYRPLPLPRKPEKPKPFGCAIPDPNALPDPSGGRYPSIAPHSEAIKHIQGTLVRSEEKTNLEDPKNWSEQKTLAWAASKVVERYLEFLNHRGGKGAGDLDVRDHYSIEGDVTSTLSQSKPISSTKLEEKVVMADVVFKARRVIPVHGDVFQVRALVSAIPGRQEVRIVSAEVVGVEHPQTVDLLSGPPPFLYSDPDPISSRWPKAYLPGDTRPDLLISSEMDTIEAVCEHAKDLKYDRGLVSDYSKQLCSL